MPARLCRHLKPDGTRCRAVAVTDRPCCLAHQRLHQRIRRMQRSTLPRTLRLGSLQDRPSIDHARIRVARAIAARTLDLDHAAALFNRIAHAARSSKVEIGHTAPNQPVRPAQSG